MKTRFNPALKAAQFRPMRATLGIVRSCCRSERGVAAVEFALAIPFVLLVLSGIIQFGFVLFLQSHVADVARDTARRAAVGELTQAEAEQFAQDKLLNWGVTYDVVVALNGTDVDVQISLPMSQAALIDVFGLFQSGTLTAAVTAREE
ncbi:MAG: TadE family protein [Nitrospirota bacterium]|nr:TadE family protein [Nitrospirota bacterium]